MSLVIARKIDDQIRILSDSKITDETAIHRSPLTGALKSVIVTRTLCVSFAGNLGRARYAISQLNEDLDLEKILVQLLQKHRDGNEDTDFIVATLIPTPALHRIAAGKVEQDIAVGWIGDSEAFSGYQEYYHTQPSLAFDKISEHKYELAKMLMAFQSVISDDAYPTVDEFLITVASSPEGFRYFGACAVFPISQQIPSGVPTVIKFGSTAEGGYGYTVMTPREAGVGAIGVHFFQGNLGALFYPIESDDPIIYRGVVADEFKNKVRQDFGFEVEGMRIS